jgi:hypothetical protein
MLQAPMDAHFEHRARLEQRWVRPSRKRRWIAGHQYTSQGDTRAN